MNEFDPDAHLELNMTDGRELRLDRSNSTFFTFLGQNAMYNHIFFSDERAEEDTVTGSYLFQYSPVYNDIARYMIENRFPGVINQTEVPDCDRQAFDRSLTQAADHDYVPDDWLDI